MWFTQMELESVEIADSSSEWLSVRRTNMMSRINRALAVLLASIALTGCAEKQEVKEPTPITVEKKDITDTAEFKQAVSQRVDEVLGGEVSLTVYLDTAEDFNYIGELEIINDGSDGTRPVIFIHADHKTEESGWW